MASNKVFQQVRRTASTQARGTSNALLAAALVHLAGTAVALGQVAPGGTPTPPPTMSMPRPKALPAQPDPNAGNPEDNNDKVRVDGNQIVDLHVNDEDLANVLEMLSIQSQKNIVASKSVTARVTANLYGVTFKEALDAILNVNGFGYVEQGNFIFVYTLKELDDIQKAQRIKVSKVVTLNYLNAVDAAEFVKPLLSDGAQIKTNGKTGNFPSPGEVPIGAEDYAGGATLVITDFDDHIGEIESLLRQLDTRPAQVLVEATIMQTTLTEDNAFGVDFSIIADMDFGDFVSIGGPIQAANALIAGRSAPAGTTPLPADGKAGAVTQNVGNTAGPGGLKAGIVKGDLAVFLRVLDEVTDTTIVSNPKILALNRQPARVLVGRKVGYLSTTSTDTATTQTVEFLDTGTQLYFRPFVSNEGVIRMELKPQVSEAIIRQANDASGKTVTIPDEDTNEVVTNVMVGDGQTIVLGGLFRESTSSTRRQVPLLGDIPLIGQVFRGNEDTTQRNEIIFLVTPSIVNDQTLSAQGQRGRDYIDHLRVGSREGVLFWSRDKLTNRRNLKAERLAQEGDTEGALWNVERSLNLNSIQPEAIAMREKLTGKKGLWPTRSVMERVINGDSEQMLKKGSKAQAAPASPMFPTIATETAEAPAPPAPRTTFSNTFSTSPSSAAPTPAPAPAPAAAPAAAPIQPAPAASEFDTSTPGNSSSTPSTPSNIEPTPAPASHESTTPAHTQPAAEPQTPPSSNTSEPMSPAAGENPFEPFSPENDDTFVPPVAPGANSTPAPTSPAPAPASTTPASPAPKAATPAAAATNSNTTPKAAAATNTTKAPTKNAAATTTTPTNPPTNPTTTAAKPADNSRLQSGKHGFMGGMWAFFKYNAAQNNTATAQAKDSTTPESTDK